MIRVLIVSLFLTSTIQGSEIPVLFSVPQLFSNCPDCNPCICGADCKCPTCKESCSCKPKASIQAPIQAPVTYQQAPMSYQMFRNSFMAPQNCGPTG